MRTILELEFSVEGMLRFISHLELQHFFSRLALRARLPVYFTQGFNPRARLSLPVPRSVGIGSLDDRLRIELEAAVDAEAAVEKLRAFLPADMTLKRAWLTEANRLQQPTAIEWRIDLGDLDPGPVAGRIADVLSGPVSLTRHSKKMNKDYTVDLRPLILDLARQDNAVRAKVAYSPQGSLRPGELLEILHLPKTEFLGRMTRTQTFWN